MRFFLIALLLQGFSYALAQKSDQPVKEGPKDSNSAEPAKHPLEKADPSLTQIQMYEVQVSDSQLGVDQKDAESTVAIVNPFSVRKRGRVYGSLYEYHRNDNFDARNFFDPVGQPLPEFKRNQFGGSFGIFLTEKLHIFGTYDGLRTIKGSTIISRVPTPQMKRGDFSELNTQIIDPLTGLPFDGNRIPTNRIHPVTQRLLSRFPDPNRDDHSRNLVNNQPYVNRNNRLGFRVDYEFNPKSMIFANYSISSDTQMRVSALESFGTTQERRDQDLSITYNHTFSSNLIASIRLNYTRRTEQELSADAGQTGLLDSLGIKGLELLDALDEGYPNVNITGYATLGYESGESPRTSFRNNAWINGNLTWVLKNHKLNFGGEFEINQVNNNRTSGLRRGTFDFTGSYTGDGFADLLLGIPGTASRGIGSNRADLRRRRWRAFAREEWKINRKYTLSASMAYNYNPFYYSVHDNVSLFYPLLFEPPIDGEIVVTGSDRAREVGLAGLQKGRAVYTDRNNWEPSIGFSYSPLGNNRIVLRASYALDYDQLDLGRALGYIGKNYPFYYIERAESSPSTPELDFSDPFASAAPAELTIRAINPHIKNASNQRYQISLETEILRNWNLEIRYRGWRGVRNDSVLAANVPLPGPGLIQSRRPNPNYGRFYIVTDNSFFNGNTMFVQLRKRLSNYFSLQSEFSWFRVFTDNTFGWDPQNPRDLAAEKGVASFRPPKEFSFNYIFDVPVGPGRAFPLTWAGKARVLLEGWRISGITRIRDGRPFHPTLFGDHNNDGLTADRPDRLGPGRLPQSERTIDRWFAVEDFAEPEPYSFGSSGRSILYGPGEVIWDISLIRGIKLTDSGKRLEFRFQMFNAFNNVNFDQPFAIFGSSLFGKIFGAGESREIEIALKYSF